MFLGSKGVADASNDSGLISESGNGVPAVRWVLTVIRSLKVCAWSCAIMQTVINNNVIRFILR